MWLVNKCLPSHPAGPVLRPVETVPVLRLVRTGKESSVVWLELRVLSERLLVHDQNGLC